MKHMDVVFYHRKDDPDSEAMREYLENQGIAYTTRHIDADSEARQEWEDLDGQVTPIITIDRTQIVRGLDCTRLEQFMGVVGC